MPFVVAITGSVASGKSTAIHFFASHGIPIVSADEINRSLLKPNTPTFTAIVDHFGEEILNVSGELNKQALRDIIFSDGQQKLWLENLLHPIIRQKIIEAIEQANGSYVVVEIPLLKSRQDYPFINRVLLIDVVEEIQLARVIERDKCSQEQAISIIRNHAPFSEKMKIADDIIENSGPLQTFIHKLEVIHANYLALAAKT